MAEKRIGLTQRLSPGREFALFGVLLVISCAVLSSGIFREGWHPNEEGLFLEEAARVLRGEVPHADFDAPSSGGLGVIHALVLTIGGRSIIPPRLFLLAAACGVLLFQMLILRRVLGAAAVLCVALVCFAWGPPIYLAPSLGWYSAFLGIIAAHFVLCYSETGNPRWGFAAGAAVAAGFLVDFWGALLLACATVLSLTCVRGLSAGQSDGQSSSRPSRAALAGPVIAILAVVAYAFWGGHRGALGALILFSICIGAVGFTVLAIALKAPANEEGGSQRPGPLRACLGGLALLLVPFFLWLLACGGLGAPAAWLHGTVLNPFPGLQRAPESALQPTVLLYLIPVNAVLLILWFLGRRKAHHAWTGACVILAAAALIYSLIQSHYASVYRGHWWGLRLLLPESIIVGCVLLWRSRTRTSPNPRYQQALAVALCFAASFAFLQLPAFTGLSFLYAFPFLLMLLAVEVAPATTELFSERKTKSVKWRQLAALTGLAYLFIFGWGYLRDTKSTSFGVKWSPRLNEGALNIEGARVAVPARDRGDYPSAVTLIERASEPGDPILAFPRCPMIYFLTGTRNPLRHYDTPGDRESLLEVTTEAVKEHGLKAVAFQDGLDPAQDPTTLQILWKLNQLLPTPVICGRFYVMSAEEPPASPLPAYLERPGDHEGHSHEGHSHEGHGHGVGPGPGKDGGDREDATSKDDPGNKEDGGDGPKAGANEDAAGDEDTSGKEAGTD